ncbi:protein YgfX [Spartinivicinus ruber]|uniref:protein YgfX n=1 Tax=Spartinivicinus ruber TaxID=2683272 RepID=UPI0013D88145|nr:protein YgfX [Spartinivicinus ruber]
MLDPARQLSLTVGSSKSLCMYIVCLYTGLAILLCWLANIHLLYKLVMVGGLLGVGCYQLFLYGLKRLPGSTVELRRLDLTQWQLIANNQTAFQGELADDCFITLPLTIVRIKLGKLLRHSLVITPDSVDKDAYRRLRVILSHDFATEPDNSIL